MKKLIKCIPSTLGIERLRLNLAYCRIHENNTKLSFHFYIRLKRSSFWSLEPHCKYCGYINIKAKLITMDQTLSIFQILYFF